MVILRVRRLAGRTDHELERNIVFSREAEIAFVVRIAHDDAAAVHDREVRYIDRDAFVIDGVDRVAPGEESLLLLLFIRPVDDGLPLHARAEFFRALRVFRSLDERLDKRVLGGYREECDAEDRIAARGERGQHHARFAVLFELEMDVNACALADPVFLHDANLLGPTLQFAQPLEEHVGILGDFEEPLLEILRLDDRVATPALAVLDLLVREDRRAFRAPVDRRLLAVCETSLVELDEEPLVPLVVLRTACDDHALPVVAAAELALLFADARYGVIGVCFRVRLVLDSGVLSRKTERVVAHRVEDVESLHALVARDDIAHRVVAAVAHVQTIGARVREHLEAVEFRPCTIKLGAEDACSLPLRLPLLRHSVEIGHD